MRKLKLVVLTGALLVMSGNALADWYVDAGLKLWYAEPRALDRALMYGPSAVLSRGDQYWVRGFLLYGEYDFVRSNFPRVVQDFSIYDAELAAGINWNIFHFGAGVRSSSVIIKEDRADGPRVRRPSGTGPAFILGASQSFADYPWGFDGSPWGWFAGLSWMFADLEDDDGEHLNFELGITHISHGFYKSVGYRFQDTFDHDRIEGVVATLLYEF